MTHLALLFGAAFGTVFFKALQGRIFNHDQYFLVVPVSVCIAFFDVAVIASVSRSGWTIPSVLTVGIGSGIGAILAMLIHRFWLLKKPNDHKTG